ncbi:MAG: ZPR1 zinc-finger domain protein [Promethearchaeota archaeon]|nr:MAG: ZPR1 zinc-finger domain protein [Candidatus Lokiarchaeota archaeon]
MSSKKAKETEEKFQFQCPSCKEGFIKILKVEYDLPDQDKVLIIRFECPKCNFSTSDVIPLTTRLEPGIMRYKVSEESDLKSKVYRSPTGELKIPELEVEVTPGPRADFYYTNIEGILDRFLKAVSTYRRDLEKDTPEYKEVEDILRDLEKAIRGEFEFTLEIKDEGGGSYIIPENKSRYSFAKLEIKENEK